MVLLFPKDYMPELQLSTSWADGLRCRSLARLLRLLFYLLWRSRVRIGVLFISYLVPGLPLNPFGNASLVFLGFIRSITELYTILK